MRGNEEWGAVLSGVINGKHKTLEINFPFYDGDYPIMKELGVEDADEVSDILRDMDIDLLYAVGEEWEGSNNFIFGYDIYDFQDMWEEYCNMTLIQQEVIEHLISEGVSSDLHDVIYYEVRMDVSVYPNMDLEDVAIELYEDGVFGECSDSLRPYIDFKALGEDLSDDGFTQLDNCVVHIIY